MRPPRSVVIDLADEMDLLELGPRAAKALAMEGGNKHSIDILRVVASLGSLWDDPDMTSYSEGVN